MSFSAFTSPRAGGFSPALLIALALGLFAAGCKPAATPAAPGAPAKTGDAAAKTPEQKAADAKAADQKAAAKKAADAEKDRARTAAAEAAPVETAPVTRGPISAFLSFNSTLETEAIVDIFPQTGGQVDALLAEEGRIVKAGDPLLKIEDRELRVDAEESTINYEHEKNGFARFEDLFQRSIINKQEYDDHRFRVEQARLRVERATLRLSYATVRAPFDGVIATRDTQVGARVGSGSKVFSMVKLDELVARVFVPGRYLPTVVENQAAVLTSEFLPDRNFMGWVKRISPVLDPKSGTFKVTVGVKPTAKPAELPPGLFVGVRIITDTRQSALLVPKKAIVYEGGERYVYAVVAGKASKRKLVAGFEDPVNIEAISGFEVGIPVIVLGQSGLKDGSPVRSVNLPGAGAPAAAPALRVDPNAPPAKASAAAVEPVKAGE